jgi:hypothetical protein
MLNVVELDHTNHIMLHQEHLHEVFELLYQDHGKNIISKQTKLAYLCRTNSIVDINVRHESRSTI